MQLDGNLIPLDLFLRVVKYLVEHPDEELIPLKSGEIMEPIIIKKKSNAETGDIEVDWFRYG